jgi:hypothetical protein
MRGKCARVHVLVRTACKLLDVGVAALADAKPSGAIAAVLAAEHAMWRRGAQDVRTLFSLDGGRTLRPFTELSDAVVDPLQVYLAVRHVGYWAEAFVMLTEMPHAPLDTVRSALRSAIPLARAGARRGDVADMLAGFLRPYALHPIAGTSAVSLGLTLDGAEQGEDVLLSGEVLSLRAGISAPPAAAILSAMVAVGPQGGELVWPRSLA